MILKLRRYVEQVPEWPASGRHVLAQFDQDTIVVYQAYRPEIAEFAATNGRFGAGFSLARMSWIKPNFLWMMYRSGWATKEGQKRILAIRLRREFFDELLALAVPSRGTPRASRSDPMWRQIMRSSQVRLQWDPDHDPAGRNVERRAIQLGLRGDMLRRYAQEAPVAIDDVTDFVASQRANARGDFADLLTPEERVYLPANAAVAAKVGLDAGASS